MKIKKTKAASLTSLRKKAEAKLGKQDKRIKELSSQGVRELAHELGTYQIELEMQNEELRRAQEELEESRSKFVDLYDLAPVGYFTFDKEGIIVEVNLTGAEMLGINRRYLLKKPFSRFLAGREDQEFFSVHRKELQRTRARQTCELMIRKKDAPSFAAQIISMPIETSAGHFRASVIDIAQRRLAEELRSAQSEIERGAARTVSVSEKKYRELFENMISGFAFHKIILDGRGKPVDYEFQEVNHAFEKLTGLKSADILGKRATEVLPGIEHDPADWIGRYGNVALTGKELRFEQLAKPLGKWLSVSAYCPMPGYFATIFEDITDRKRAEEALKESERRYHSLFDNMTEGFTYCKMLFDNNSQPVDFVYLEVNDSFGRLTGLSNVVGKKVSEVIPGIREADPELFQIYGRVALACKAERFEFYVEALKLWFSISAYCPQKEYFIAVFDVITARKNAEEALRESEKQFRTLADSIPNLAWWANGDGYITWYNKRWYAYTGTTPEQMEGWGWQSVPDPKMLPIVLERWKASITTGEPFDMEFPLRGADGLFRTFLTRVLPLKDSAGQVLRWFGTNTDISAIKQAEDALRESEEKYRSIIETASEGIWIGDFEGRTTFVNESASKMIGYRPEELIGKTAYDFMDEEARAIGRLNLERRRQGHKNSYEMKFIRKDGSTLWAIVGATPLRDKTGNAVASMAMLTDITGRKLAEEKTFRQQAVLTSINRIFREALATDSEEELGRVCLSIAEELTGSKFGFIGEIGPDGLIHATAISDHGWDLCTIKDKTARHKPLGAFKVHGLFGRVIIDERPLFTNDPYSQHDSIGTPEGHPRLTAFLGVPMIHRGKVIGLIALGNREGGYRSEDVETMEPLATVIVQALMRKRTEASLQTAHVELRQRAYELEAVNRELEAFSYTVSHDLKAPLRSIDGFTRALLEDYGDKLDSTARDYLMRVNSAALRMDQLIQAMLDMARLTRRELNEQSVDLSALAQVIADNLRKQDLARMVEFIIADKIRVRGDNTLLQAVLENLMHNAWRFTGKHKTARIEFGVTMMEGHSVYFVRDDGAGFDMQFADKIFMPFNRLHTESEFTGLGIGLATAYRIILRHNGRLWAESAPEKGATFYFTLP